MLLDKVLPFFFIPKFTKQGDIFKRQFFFYPVYFCFEMSFESLSVHLITVMGEAKFCSNDIDVFLL